MTQLTVSVVIPAYNAAGYLAETVATVRAQTRQPEEILVVDDCSSDATEVVARALGVRFIRLPENSGVSTARNFGAAHAVSDLIAWLDADDLWQPEHLAITVPLLEQFPEAGASFGRARMFGDQTDEWPALIDADRPVWATDACLKRTIFLPSTAVVRRTAHDAVGGFDAHFRLAEDFDMWLRLSHRFPVVCTHRITAGWRRHRTSLSAGTIHPYQEYEYESRLQFLERARAEGASDVAQLEAKLRSVWRGHLQTAWECDDLGGFRFHLAMRRYVPGSTRGYLRWRAIGPLRVAWPLAARAWRTLPSPVRQAVKRAFGRPVVSVDA